MATICKETGKSKLSKFSAKNLVRTCSELHHFYKCECGTYHVSSNNYLGRKRK